MAKMEQYLGDGVYATFDGYQVWLDCRAQIGLAIGPSGTPSIALEPPVLKRLADFVSLIKSAQEDTPAIFNRPECPFNYCDQEPPYAACQEHCRHRPPTTP